MSLQKINVITCVLNNFHENQKFNKENLINYKEIYLEVKFDNLVKRDNKSIYKKALEGNLNNVIGVDIDFVPPYSPDIIIDNNADNTNFENIASNIIKKLDLNFDLKYKYTSVNLLKCPTKYQYSKFEGKDFLKKSKIDREDSLDFLVLLISINYSFAITTY